MPVLSGFPLREAGQGSHSGTLNATEIGCAGVFRSHGLCVTVPVRSVLRHTDLQMAGVESGCMPGLRTLSVVLCVFCLGQVTALAAAPKKIVLIAGKKSHGPVGNGIHDYPWSVKLLKVMLDNSSAADRVKVEYHLDGWPEDPHTLNDADSILIVSDGRDGDLYEEAPHFSTAERRDLIAQQIARGCGFATFHFSTFAPDQFADDILNWSGAYFDWETDGKRQWYSAIKTLDTAIERGTESHPVLNGVRPFRMKEEFYFNLRFREGDPTLTRLLVVPELSGRAPDGNVVAWCKERSGGGRGFGTTCGHFYENWKNEDFRRFLLNALLWTAQAEVPENGVESRYFPHDEVTRALTGIEGTQRATLDTRPIRALILGGHHHPGHHWAETSPALQQILERDPRLNVDISSEIEDLASKSLGDYDLLVMNYCNWERPGLSDAAKQKFVDYLHQGGGLMLIHFANGAFHHSLPNAAESDWPEYRNICRRVWDHSHRGTGHDSYGKFMVEIVDDSHPVTKGMEPFQTIDELYFGQVGSEPISVLATAKSKVTGKEEPMAFVYEYHKARVFQTVLGHARESLLTDGTSELIRRAAPWVAQREPLPPGQLKTAAPPTGPARLSEGKFGSALNGVAGGAWIDGRQEFGETPLTVECWAKLHGANQFQILIAHEDKSSGTHWELFTPPGSGTLSAYLPGYEPDHLRTSTRITDDKWYHIAMILDQGHVALYVDGALVGEQAIRRNDRPRVAGELAIATLVNRDIGCSGLIDEVRISRGRRTIRMPLAPLESDADTLGLWRFDLLTDGAGKEAGTSPDASSHSVPARLSAMEAGSAKPPVAKAKNHWGEDAVGFKWTEEDSVDNRWNQTDIGPFLASVVPLPNLPPIEKGLSIKVGDAQEATVCFDTQRLEWRAAWTGGFLKFNPARFGLISPPHIHGTIAAISRPTDGWGTAPAQYRGLTQCGQRVILNYQVGETSIRESPWLETSGALTLFTRQIEVGPSTSPLRIPVYSGTSPLQLRTLSGVTVATCVEGDKVVTFAIRSDASQQLEITQSNQLVIRLPPHSQMQRLSLDFAAVSPAQLNEFAGWVNRHPLQQNLADLAQQSRALWTAPIVTQGERGQQPGAFQLDTIGLPFQNPYQALMFISGHDFFSNGELALCTVHGDVWRVTGIDDQLQELKWKRFATGLFQPLGLKIINDEIHVLGRDQITRLRDLNNDGEADDYVCVNNRYQTSPGGHDYVACLETDSHGDFYFVHANQGVVRAPRDGSAVEVIATGLRNPVGLSIGPQDAITAAPQEGEWTPASAIFPVKKGNHFGYRGPQVTEQRPLGYDPPICWIPRLIDNSSGGQTWIPSNRWGPLAGQLLHFSFGKCRMMLTLQEQVDGLLQGGTVDFPFDFESGIMRGRFHPVDGQLYVSGLRGWVSAAVQDGCLQRVRWTDQPIDMPVNVKTCQNGLAITFSSSLDPQSANDVDSYSLQQWNYRYSGTYGSPEFRVSHSLEEGRDEVDVRSATLLKDGRTVFLEIPGLRPVMQMGIQYKVATRTGRPVQQTLYYTIHRIRDEAIPESELNRAGSMVPGSLTAEEQAALQPGLTAHFEQNGKQDVRRLRLAALTVPANTAPSTFLQPGPFQLTCDGVIKVPLRGEYQFWLEGLGTAALQLNGEVVLPPQGIIDADRRVSVSLRRGENRLKLIYHAPDAGDARFRLMWKGTDFPEEAVPPTILWSSSQNSDLARSEQLRQGQHLFQSLRCQNCHAISPEQALDQALNQAVVPGPDLENAGDRFQPSWMARWILHPHELQHETRMPQVLNPDRPENRQNAADIAAWLATITSTPQPPWSPPGEEQIAAGEKLFEMQGCYTCHHFSEGATADEFGRRSLAAISQKWTPAGLKRFLADPTAHFPLTRMPKFSFDETEINGLAAYLQSRSASQTEAPIPELAHASPKRGQELFLNSGCVQCHSIDKTAPGIQAQRFSPFPGSLQGGCLNDGRLPTATTPDFALNSEDRAALTRFLASGEFHSLKTVSVAEMGAMRMSELRCAACHTRDGAASPRAAIAIEEFDTGLLPESLPVLTWTGEKLHSAWIARFLKGEVPHKPRPWLSARMPAFPAFAEELAAGLAAEHGMETGTVPHAFRPELARIGNELSLRNTGLDCRQCHAVGKEQPSGDHNTQIALGINFELIRDRLRPEFFRRFILDPPRYEVNTKMPKLAADGMSTKIHTHFDGDARQQFDALWNYIQSLEREQLP